MTPDELARVPEPFDYINRTYGVSARIGQRVSVYGKMGTVVQDNGNYLGVKLDGMKYVCNAHPTDGVVYHD